MTAAFCLWLGLFPLLHGGSYSHLTHDKWIAMLILSGVTLLCFLADACMRRLARPRIAPVLFAAGLLLCTAFSCFFCGYPPEIWWEGLSARWEGLATELVYFGLFFLFSFSRVSLRPAVYSAFAGLCGYLVIVFLQRAGGNPFNLYPYGTSYALNPEFQGTIGNVDMVTGYGVLLAALFLGQGLALLQKNVRLRRQTALPDQPETANSSGENASPGQTGTPSFCRANLIELIICALGFALSVYLVLSMEVQFGLISLGFLALITVLRVLPRRFRLPLLILLLVLALIVVWFWPGQGGGLWELHEILHGRTQLSFGSNRVAVWLYSLRLSGEKPLLGGGSGTFQIRFNQYLENNSLTIPKSQNGVLLPHYFDNPHNMYIAQLTDHGIPAMLLFLALVLSPLMGRKKTGKSSVPGLYTVLTYGVQAFFSFSVCMVSPLFWVLLGDSAQRSAEET